MIKKGQPTCCCGYVAFPKQQTADFRVQQQQQQQLLTTIACATKAYAFECDPVRSAPACCHHKHRCCSYRFYDVVAVAAELLCCVHVSQLSTDEVTVTDDDTCGRVFDCRYLHSR